MSEIKYGLISKVDAECIEATLNYIMSDFPDEVINVCELGIYSGLTGHGILKYASSRRRIVNIIGVDNNKDGQTVIERFAYSNLIIGNSNEVYNQIPDESQHLIFEDSCHCFAHVVSTFFCYAPKVKVGGYFAFHDTGKHIAQFKDFQHGDEGNPDAYISVRKALNIVGLLEDNGANLYYDRINCNIVTLHNRKWKLVFDEADETDEAGGICVFKKLN